MRSACLVGPNGVGIAYVPKVASTSIKSAVLAWQGIEIADHGVHRHPALEQMPIDDALRAGMTVFALVRNPLERLVSVWADKVAGSAAGTGKSAMKVRRKAGVGEDASFERFARRLTAEAIRADVHMTPQADLLPKGVIVGKYEDLPESWAAVREMWPGLPELPRLNVSSLKIAPSKKARRAVRYLYADDYERFGYQ